MESKPSEVTLVGNPKRRIVYLVRHAQAHHNVLAEAASKYDPVLTETGVTQAVVLRTIFRPPNPSDDADAEQFAMSLILTQDGRETTFHIPEPRIILASPFRRTLQTAALLFCDAPNAEQKPIIAEVLIQESGSLNCDTGSPLDTLKKEFGGALPEVVQSDDEDEDGRPARRQLKKRKTAAELVFAKRCPKLPPFDFSNVDDPEWHLKKRKDGDNPFQRAWEFKEKLWQIFDQLEESDRAVKEEEQQGHVEVNGDVKMEEVGNGKAAESDILGPIAVVTHGGFLKSLLTWDNGEHFSPFANAEIRAYELRLAEVDPSLVKSKATAKGGEPLVHEVKDDHWTVIELEQLSMEELAKT